MGAHYTQQNTVTQIQSRSSWRSNFGKLERTYSWRQQIKYINLISTSSSKIAQMTKRVQNQKQKQQQQTAGDNNNKTSIQNYIDKF